MWWTISEVLWIKVCHINCLWKLELHLFRYDIKRECFLRLASGFSFFIYFLINQVEIIFFRKLKKFFLAVKIKILSWQTLSKEVLKQLWDKKERLWIYGKDIFCFFANFWSSSSLFSNKVRENLCKFWNEKFIINNDLKNELDATLTSKMNVYSVYSRHFLFCSESSLGKQNFKISVYIKSLS